MAATPIAALNKTTQNSFLRIIESPIFTFSFDSFGIAEWRRADTIRQFGRRSQRARSGFMAVPLFTVEWRDLLSYRTGSGGTIWRLGAGLPDARRQRSKSGERDGRRRPRHTTTYKTRRRPAGFVEGNRGVPRPRRDHGAALGKARGDAGAQACARQDGLGLRFSCGVGCVGARPEHSGFG